jgi:hypothetical protein
VAKRFPLSESFFRSPRSILFRSISLQRFTTTTTTTTTTYYRVHWLTPNSWSCFSCRMIQLSCDAPSRNTLTTPSKRSWVLISHQNPLFVVTYAGQRLIRLCQSYGEFELQRIRRCGETVSTFWVLLSQPSQHLVSKHVIATTHHPSSWSVEESLSVVGQPLKPRTKFSRPNFRHSDCVFRYPS